MTDKPPHTPEAALLRRVARIRAWCAAAQAALAGVPGATLEDQRVLRELAARLEQRALADALK